MFGNPSATTKEVLLHETTNEGSILTLLVGPKGPGGLPLRHNMIQAWLGYLGYQPYQGQFLEGPYERRHIPNMV
jgi:hypothetical protein